MNIVDIPVGAVGIDCLSPISAAVAVELAALVIPGTKTGITYVDRYLNNLTSGELDGILAAGLGCAFVSEARVADWGAPTGAADALRAVTRARALNLESNGPKILHIGCDLEGMSCSTQDAMAYATAWGKTIQSGGFGQKIYVGAEVPLTPAQLFQLPGTIYWRGLSNEQQVASCDYGIWQLFPTTTLNLSTGPFQVDLDVVCKDKHNRLPTMVAA